MVSGEHVLAALGEFAGLRHEVLVDDAARHVPIGIEVDLHDLARELGRLPLELADHGGMALGHLPVLDRFNLRGRNVDRDVAPRGRRRQGLQPLQIGLELSQPNARRHVHHVDGGPVDGAGRRQGMARLEFAHGLGQSLIVFIGDALPGEIAADLKPPMQDLNRLSVGAGLHGVGRNRWPAAIRHDALVALNRGLGRLDVARGERRRAERRVGDPLPCGFRALLGRKLVAMESA